MTWQHFHHDADIGIRGIAKNKSDAFEQAALALTAIITELESVKPAKTISFSCHAPDDEILFNDWINTLIYEMAVRKMLFSKFQVQITGHNLLASISGEPVSVERHHPAVEIKGATFTELKVTHKNNGDWLAQCIVDV